MFLRLKISAKLVEKNETQKHYPLFLTLGRLDTEIPTASLAGSYQRTYNIYLAFRCIFSNFALDFNKLFRIMAKREYMQANKEWLAAKAKEEGGKALDKGIYYKVVAEGRNDGRHPSRRDIVTVHYTGWTINGKKFDSSRGGTPVAFRLADLIEGWIVAMQQMCVGDKWEIYLPAEMGYGKYSQPGIPAGSTLIFEIELISIA